LVYKQELFYDSRKLTSAVSNLFFSEAKRRLTRLAGRFELYSLYPPAADESHHIERLSLNFPAQHYLTLKYPPNVEE
ncbi:hypothetical protein JOQ06_020328, partial [Pogonophryne albipinna]